MHRQIIAAMGSDREEPKRKSKIPRRRFTATCATGMSRNVTTPARRTISASDEPSS